MENSLASDNKKQKKLSDITELITDGSHFSPRTLGEGLPYVTVRDISDKGEIDIIGCKKISQEDFNKLVSGNCKPEKGDILFSKDGTVGKVALVSLDTPFVVLSSLAIIRPKKNIVLPKFLTYLFLSPNIRDEAIGLKTGAAIKRIVLKTLKNLKFPTPSLNEQKHIVEKLDALFARIDKAIAMLEENIQHTQALMGSMMDNEFKRLEDTKGYPVKPLAEVIKVINGRAYKKPELLDSGKYPVLRVGNFFTNRSWYYSDLELDDDKYCEEGDLLYAWSASFGPKIWDGPKSIYHYHIWKMVPHNGDVSKDYLFYLLERDTEKIKEEGGRGVGMIHITKGGIEKRKMVIPPIEVQEDVVNRIHKLKNSTEKLLREQTQKLNNLKSLKSSLLDAAFKGELTQAVKVPA